MQFLRTDCLAVAIASIAVAFVLTSSVTAQQGPTPVSPGNASALETIESRCPTFSWSAAANAGAYELALYRVAGAPAAEGGRWDTELVTRSRFPAGATSWTPPLDECLDRGRRYAWSVRTIEGPGADAWSRTSFFRISTAPSEYEVRAAIETLRRYVDAKRTGKGRTRSPGGAALTGTTAVEAESTRSSTNRTTSIDRRGFRPSSATLERNAASEPAGAPASAPASLTLSGQVHLDSDSALFKHGETFLWDDASGNLGLGESALAAAVGTATFNTAVGFSSLSNTTEGSVAMEGSYNTALGDSALRYNQVGFDNTALGSAALVYNEGYFNTGVGSSALGANTSGEDNTAVGAWAAVENTTGLQNVGVGSLALSNNTTGSGNIAVGYRAGSELGDTTSPGTSMSDNIFIGNLGGSDEVGTIRIGNPVDHTRTFLAGVTGTPVNGLSVLVNSNGQLGTTSSSRRFKSDVETLGNVATRLLELRPVTFRYRPTVTDEGGGTHVGLVAEEVAEVFPELVVRDDAGKPLGVRYELLSVLLLEELQRQHQGLAVLRRRVTALEEGHDPARDYAPWWRAFLGDRDRQRDPRP